MCDFNQPFSNLDLLQVGPGNPIKLFGEVKLNGVPVMDARVTAHIRALNQSGALSKPVVVELFDSGNGGKSLTRLISSFLCFILNISQKYSHE